MSEFIEENTILFKFIVNKYGIFNEDNLIKFFKDDFYNNRLELNYESISDILKEIDRLVKGQNIKYEDIIYLGYGQSYACLAIGNACLKVGKKIDVEYEDYRLNPLYEKSLGEKVSLYVSQLANGKKATHNDVLDFYQTIRESGGLWLDAKENNLGFVNEKLNSEKIYGVENDSEINKPYLLDYEDVIYLDEENIDYYLEWFGNDLDYKKLRFCHDYNEVLYHLFIQKRNELLQIEKEIAIKNDDIELAHSLEVQQIKNSEGLTNYYDSDYYEHDDDYPISNELLNLSKRNKINNFFNKFRRGR
ncbi:MAG: hypothetical protein IJS56_06865 [Bacilli bacterium]|nr:hypothetical protein [Bacilli bacterium]